MRRLLSALATVALLAGCAATDASRTPSLTFPEALLPAQSIDGFEFVAQPELDKRFAKQGGSSLITAGKLFTIRSGATVEGSFQTTLFRKGVNNQDAAVQSGIEKGLGAGGNGFTTVHLGLIRLETAPTGDEVLYLWFPPGHDVMELFVLRSGFSDAGGLVRSIVAAQLGLDLTAPAGGTS